MGFRVLRCRTTRRDAEPPPKRTGHSGFTPVRAETGPYALKPLRARAGAPPPPTPSSPSPSLKAGAFGLSGGCCTKGWGRGVARDRPRGEKGCSEGLGRAAAHQGSYLSSRPRIRCPYTCPDRDGGEGGVGGGCRPRRYSGPLRALLSARSRSPGARSGRRR
jgi:hypothetical protein